MCSSPARPAGSAPPSSPSSSARDIRSSGSPARTRRRLPSRPQAPTCIAARSTTSTASARGAGASDGVIHLAFKRDLAFSGDFPGAADADRRAIETFGEVLAGSDRPFLIASGTLGLAPGRVATERAGHGHDPAAAPAIGGAEIRMANAQLALSFAATGVRASVVRLPPTVHGDGDHGFVATLVDIARDRGVSGSIGDGTNRWPAVHRLDAAHLFRLALDKAPAGSTLHAVADTGVPIRDIAEVIGRHLDLPVVSVAPEDAGEHFAWLAGFLAADSPASSALTRELLGWQPTQLGLIDDLDKGHYFDARSAS